MVNHPKFNNGSVPSTDEEKSKFLRLPFGFIMFSEDSDKDGKHYDGSVMFSHGDDKKERVFISYTDFFKIYSFVQENKEMFNRMLIKERERSSVGLVV